MTGSPARAKGMLLRLCGAALGLGFLAMAAQWLLADAAAQWWLGDLRAAPALRAAAFGMPFMAVSAVIRGVFCGPAAGGAQRGQPDGGAAVPDRGDGHRSGVDPGSGCGGAVRPWC